MSKMKVMRFDWETDVNDRKNFWELIRNARDDIQFVILDRTSENVIFKLGIEPTSLVKRDLPGNIQVTDRNEATKRVAMTSRSEGEDAVSVSVSIDSEADWPLFLQQHCSFSPVIVKLSTTSYGERSQSSSESESVSFTKHQEMISNFITTNLDCHRTSELTPKFVSRCIYESGEFCTFQHYYILETDGFDLSKCSQLSPETFNLEVQKEKGMLDKLIGDKMFVAMRTQDITEFCKNSRGLLMSPNLIVCLQHILRCCNESLLVTFPSQI